MVLQIAEADSIGRRRCQVFRRKRQNGNFRERPIHPALFLITHPSFRSAYPSPASLPSRHFTSTSILRLTFTMTVLYPKFRRLLCNIKECLQNSLRCTPVTTLTCSSMPICPHSQYHSASAGVSLAHLECNV